MAGKARRGSDPRVIKEKILSLVRLRTSWLIWQIPAPGGPVLRVRRYRCLPNETEVKRMTLQSEETISFPHIDDLGHVYLTPVEFLDREIEMARIEKRRPSSSTGLGGHHFWR